MRQKPIRRRGATDASNARALLATLEERLGVGVIVSSVDPGPPARIAAVLVIGRYHENVEATGSTEADAWLDLGRIAVRWRTTNEKSFVFWPGAGG